MPHREFSLEEAARYLHLTVDDLQARARAGDVPGRLAGGRWLFRRHAVDEWASRHILELPGAKLEDYHHRSSAAALDLSPERAILPELVSAEWCRPAMQARTRASVLRELVDLADRTGRLNDKEALLNGLEERERQVSTALAGGVAIPHPAHYDPYLFEGSFVVVAHTVQPIPFGSPLGECPDVFLLLCCPDDRLHLHVLARLCMICHHTDALEQVRAAATPDAIREALLAAERRVLARPSVRAPS